MVWIVVVLITSLAGIAYLLAFCLRVLKGGKGWMRECLFAMGASWYRGQGFGLRGRYISSIPGIAAFSGDPGFAWIAFPVKLRVGSSGVVGWP